MSERIPDYFITNNGYPNILIINKKNKIKKTVTTTAPINNQMIKNNLKKCELKRKNKNECTTNLNQNQKNNYHQKRQQQQQRHQQQSQHQQKFDDNKLLKNSFNENVKNRINNNSESICKLSRLDNRQNYQKKYDNTIFGKYNEILTNQIVLPPIDV